MAGTKGAREHHRQRRTPRSGVAVGAIVIGSCILWQLFWMKQAFVDRERYRIGEIVTKTTIPRNGHGDGIPRHDESYYGTVPVPSVVESLKQWSAEAESREGNDQTLGHMHPQRAAGLSEIGDNESALSMSKSEAQPLPPPPSTLLNTELIRNTLLREAPWAESHGANHLSFLGAGMLYYSMAYSFRSKTIVVLGSGGGFVPRMLRQAQRDLRASGVVPDENEVYELYLVDAHLASAGWGSTFYAENENTTMRQKFSDIRYVFRLTDDAFEEVFRPMHEAGTFSIDYLHVDADHGFEQSWKDFDQYSRLLSDRAVVSFHDTCYETARNCHEKGVPETMERLRSESQTRGLQVVNLHYLYRGIAFAVREQAPALVTPKDRAINFCVNNADLLDRTSEGFTKNGRVGSLPSLGDFMNCTKYSRADLEAARSVDPGSPTRGIMAVPCPKKGYRRHPISGKCDKCIPGLTGSKCSRSRYVADGEERRTDRGGDLSGEEDVVILANGWLKAAPGSAVLLEVGPNAWRVSNAKKRTEDFVSSRASLLFSGSDRSKRLLDTAFRYTDVLVVDPFLVVNPLWIDPTVSSKHRVLPCTLKDAIDFDEAEFRRNPSWPSALGVGRAETLVCLECDDLAAKKTGSAAAKFFEGFFPHLHTIVLGLEDTENSGAFLDGVVVPGEGDTDTVWRLDRDVTLSLGDGSKKRLVLLTYLRSDTIAGH
eukprot:jgi/Psemu1/22673/gm1.22673_g